MGTIVLSTKPNGSTNWVDGDSVSGAGLVADINIIANAINGNIDTTNLSATAGVVNGQIAAGTLLNDRINASAGIAPTKIDDWASTDAQHNTILAPGDSTTNVPPVDLSDELEQLRYQAKRLGVGVNARLEDGTTAGLGADGQAAWFEQVPIGPGLARNAAFLDATANGAGTPPFGWTTVQTPSTLARVTLTVGEGSGEAIHIVDDGGADCGISQTFAGLRAESLYLAICRVRPITTTFRLVTTGAVAGSYGDLALVSASGGSLWQTLAGVVETDSTPTDIVVSLVANAANAACHTCYLDLIPLGDDQIRREREFKRVRTSSATVTATMETNTTVLVPVPGPGYRIVVDAEINFIISNTGGPPADSIVCELERSTDGGATWPSTATSRTPTLNFTGASVITYTDWAQLKFEETTPTPGTVYGYRLSLGATTAGAGFPASPQHRIEVRLERN